ncbi:MAG: dTDP-4-dehydrorhamnose 3,5-epimerase family protein [Patescibacteria group bacterium]|jgi:dTDP-4-dehydrorhamnose 3,5-epimerase
MKTHFLTIKDFEEKTQKNIYKQNYISTRLIEGVKLVDIKNIPSEEGDFSEIVRLNKGRLKQIPDFEIAQINRTRLLPNSIKAWHLHFKQDFVWYVSPFDHLFVGLWDLRKKSKTNGQIMRIILGAGRSRLLLIPKGVAQGTAVFQHLPLDLYVLSDQEFNIKNPDERRLPWDSLGQNFWFPKKD